MKKDFDAIVIGTGIGGSACAALLSQAGLKTLVLEKNSRVGGMCSSYEKEGFTIDSAIHVFSSGIKGRFGKIMKKIGLDTLKFVPIAHRTGLRALGQKGYTKLSFDPNVSFGKSQVFQDSDQVDLSGMGFKKDDMKVLIQLMGKILQTGKRKLKKMHEEQLTFETYLQQFPLTSGIKSLLAFLVGGMFGLAPRTASAPELIQGLQEWVITNDLSYPLGGAIAVPRAFLGGVTKYEGEVRTNAKVSKILVEDEKAVGVEVDGAPIFSNVIVSNAGMKPTVQKLVEKGTFENAYLEKVKDLKPSYSTITYKFALSEPLVKDYVWVNLYHGDLSIFGEKERKPDGPRPMSFMMMIPSNADPSLAPPGHQLVIFGTLAPTRPRDWKKFTDHYYQDILKFYPEIEENALFVDITNPIDLQKWSGKAFGPIETTALTPTQSGPYRISSELPIEGLYVVGDTAGTNTHGIGTQLAADSGIQGAKLILKKYKEKQAIYAR